LFDTIFYNTIRNIGSTSGASVTIAPNKAAKGEVENYSLTDDDKVLLTAVGG
jgi:hypothetical protein